MEVEHEEDQDARHEQDGCPLAPVPWPRNRV